MKIIIVFFFLLLSCSRKSVSHFSIGGKYYESQRGHLFGANKLWLNSDSTFKFILNGPSIFLSLGSWKYDKLNNTIELFSSQDIIGQRRTVDTMWIDMTGKIINVTNEKQLMLDQTTYYLIENKSLVVVPDLRSK